MKDTESAPKNSGQRLRRIVSGLCVGVVVLSLVAPSAWIESSYSRGIYPWIQAVLVPLFGILPVPVMGVVLILAPFGLGILAFRRWRARRRAGIARRDILWAGTRGGLRLGLHVYVAFLLLWGLGYRRVPIESRWQLDAEYVQGQETLVTRGWRRLREVTGLEIPVIEYPLSEVWAKTEKPL